MPVRVFGCEGVTNMCDAAQRLEDKGRAEGRL